jgi:uncharacterized protein
MKALYVTDLHGRTALFDLLADCILKEKPRVLFIGGDIFPGGRGLMAALNYHCEDFVNEFLVEWCNHLKVELGALYPDIFLIMGNDDSAYDEFALKLHPQLWTYCHNLVIDWIDFKIIGYNCIPPSPFLNKDWERFDVSRYVDPGCIPPDEGRHTYPPDEYEYRKTIQDELDELSEGLDISRAICLFHCPPYKTDLDRAALDGLSFDYAPLDVHIGSIAIQRFIEKNQPMLGLFGHVHESSRLTGIRSEIMENTLCINCATDDNSLCIAQFDLQNVVENLEFVELKP